MLFQDCDECPYGMQIREATKKGYDIARCGDSINLSFPESKTRRGRSAKTLPRRWKPLVIKAQLLPGAADPQADAP